MELGIAAFSAVIVLAIWLGISIMVGFAAHSRGRGPFVWFLFSLIFSPVLALLFLLVFPARTRPAKDEYDDAALYRNIRRNRNEPTF